MALTFLVSALVIAAAAIGSGHGPFEYPRITRLWHFDIAFTDWPANFSVALPIMR